MFREFDLNEKNLKYPLIEVFYDSPFSGGDDKKWKSQTYINIKINPLENHAPFLFPNSQ